MPWDPKRMGFLDHLDEFRRRLSIALAVILVGSLVAYFFSAEVMAFLLAPIGKSIGQTIGEGFKLNVLSPMEAFALRFKIGVFVSVVVTSPVWLYQFLAFITPAIKPGERRWFFPGLVALVAFFALGNVFCYMYVLGPGFQWMINQAGEIMTVFPKATEYVNFAIYFLLGFGLAFETPVVVFVLVKLRVIEPDALFRQWRWAVVIILVVASIATPDWSPVTMGALALAMLALYFGAAVLARWTT